MAIKGRRPTPTPIAAVLGIENNKGELVAQRNAEHDQPIGQFVGYELTNTPAFAMQDAAMEYFQRYVRNQPPGYFTDADVPILEKLCVLNVMYDRAMNEYMERPLLQKDDVLGGETVDPHFGMMLKLTDQIARLVKLIGMNPLDRGRPVVDRFGKPVQMAGGAVDMAQAKHDAIQDKFWAKKSNGKNGLN